MALHLTLEFPSHGGAGPIAGVLVHRYELRAALSELFELCIELASTDPSLDFHAVIGEAIIVHFPDEPAQKAVQGIVRGVRQLSSDVGHKSPSGEQPSKLPSGQSFASSYAIDVVPPLWLTTRRRDHRIFVKQDAPGIVAEILRGYDLRIPAPVVNLRREPPKREYTAQYGETDWDFISRILAADGITSFFDHASASAWTLLDDTTTKTPKAAGETPFVPPSNLLTPPPHVFNVVVASSVETSATHIRDYAFTNVDAPLDADGALPKPDPKRAETDALYTDESKLEAYVFEVGKFSGDAAGKDRASRLLEALRASGRTYTMEANFTLSPGAQIDLGNHPRGDADGAFVVVRTRVIEDDGAAHAGEQAVNTHVLECVASSVPFLPVPWPKPRIHGTQTAMVVGGEDGEIVSDTFGRAKLQFRWDRRSLGPTTRMVRVSQAWAGGGFGFFALPRVGDEVIVTYLDGDPDEPLVVGRVHDNKRMPPVNPVGDARTISTWRSQTLKDPSGYNEVLMDDATAKERLELHAQRDYRSTVEHDAATTIKHDDALTVGHDKTDKVDGAYTMTSGSTTISTGPYALAASKIKETAKTTILIDAGDSITEHAKKIELKGDSTVSVTGGSITLQAGGSSITIDGSGVTIKGAKVTITASGNVDIDGALILLN